MAVKFFEFPTAPEASVPEESKPKSLIEYPEQLRTEVSKAAERFFHELDQLASRHQADNVEMLSVLDGQGSNEAYNEWMYETWEFEAQG